MQFVEKYKVVKPGKKFKVGETVVLVPTKSDFKGVVLVTNGYASHYVNIARLQHIATVPVD